MAYLYRTKRYSKKAEPMYGQKVEKYLLHLENCEDPAQRLDQYWNSKFFKKQIDNLRIILQKLTIEINGTKHDVFCVLTVLPRGDKDYPFERDHDRATMMKCFDSISVNESEKREIKEWLEKEIQEQNRREEESRKLPNLPENLQKWLSWDIEIPPATIYESQKWIESFRKKEISNFKETICCGLFAIQDLSFPEERVVWKHNNRDIRLCKLDNDIFLLIEAVAGDKRPLYLLYEAFKGRPNDEFLQAYPFPELSDEDALIRFARRAYPEWILADPEIWFEVEADEVANLALSPEEADLLQSAAFPMFINGQAGSGKSTMLFYLFAHFCSMSDKGDKLLFLTYNKKLLETAQKSVTSILQKKYLKTDINIASQYFHPFQDFVLSLLSQEDRSRFSKSRYISFNTFKNCLLRKHHKKELNYNNELGKYSPEIIWHVIRTYIKGYRQDSYLSPEEYDGIPKGDKSVSKETYQDIYEKFWNGWYSSFHSEHQLWDDQDLMRYVLGSNITHPNFPVIFCDEAQDFTRIELRFLLNLSSFTKYNIFHRPNIPIAFAGDPYQTINPTGFRWASVKAALYNTFNEITHQKIGIQYRPLAQNYRSKPAIIKFLNLIQFFRYHFLDLKDLKPQLPWQSDEGISPCYLILDKDIRPDSFKDIADETIILIPTDGDESQEFDFARKDKVLENFIEDAKLGVIKNVMSASTSKGLEFEKVIVYKFGESSPPSLQKAINGNELNDSEFIELSHFFNKLYVALSRAKDYLFIIDTEEGYNKFWQHFTNLSLFKSHNQKEVWSEHNVSELVQGKDVDIEHIKEKNPLQVAETLEKSGIHNQDPSLLKRASQYYRSVSKEYEADKCLAFAYLYDDEYTKAGEQFKKIGDKDNASKAFWKAQNWTELKDLHKEGHLLHLTASYMLRGIAINSFLSNEVIEHFDVNDDTWNSVVEQLKKDFDMHNKKFASFAEKIASRGFVDFYNTAAEIHYNVKNYELAVKLWEDRKNVNHDKYYESKLNLSSNANERIQWLQKLERYKDIIKESKAKDLDEQSHHIIFGAFIQERQFEEAFSYSHIHMQDKLRALKNEIDRNDGFRNKIAVSLVLDHSNWKELIEQAGISSQKMLKSFADYVCEEVKSKNSSIISKIAYSKFTPDPLLYDLREQLERCFMEYYHSSKHKYDDKQIQEFAAALERVGAKSITLYDVYEYIIKNHPLISDWAKIRWIKVAERQVKYERYDRNDEKAARKLEDEIREKEREWKLNRSDIEKEPEYPILEQSFTHQNVRIFGLNKIPKIEDDKNRIVISEFSPIEIKINYKKRVISILDNDEDKTVDIDYKQQRIAGLEIEEHSSKFWLEGKYEGEFRERGIQLLINNRKVVIIFEDGNIILQLLINNRKVVIIFEDGNHHTATPSQPEVPSSEQHISPSSSVKVPQYVISRENLFRYILAELRDSPSYPRKNEYPPNAKGSPESIRSQIQPSKALSEFKSFLDNNPNVKSAIENFISELIKKIEKYNFKAKDERDHVYDFVDEIRRY